MLDKLAIFKNTASLMKESLPKKKFINATLYLMALTEIYSNIKDDHSVLFEDKKRVEQILEDHIELWMEYISNLQKTDNSDEKYLILNFSIMILQHFFSNPIENIEFSSLQKEINLNLGYHYLSKLKESYDEKKLIQSIQHLKKCQLIGNSFQKPAKDQDIRDFKLKILDFKNLIIELRGDYKMDTADYFHEGGEIRESLINIKDAYKDYKRINHSPKQEAAKKKYLEWSVSLGKKQLNLGDEYLESNNERTALFYYQMALKIFKKIRAQKEKDRAKARLQEYYEILGDKKYDKAKDLSNNSLDEIIKKIEVMEDANHYFKEANHQRMYKKTYKKLDKLNGRLRDILERESVRANKENKINKEYVYTEILYEISFEQGDKKASRKYSKKLEHLNEKIEEDRVKYLKETLFGSQNKSISLQEVSDQVDMMDPLSGEDESDDRGGSLIGTHVDFKNAQTTPLKFKDSDADNLKSGNIQPFKSKPNTPDLSDMMGETTPKFQADGKTYFQPTDPFDLTKSKHSIQIQRGDPETNKKTLYSIIKNFNSRLFLSDEEINFLKEFGINLPESKDFYYRYPHTDFQFFVYENKNQKPRVFFIPTKSITKKQSHLGIIASFLDLYIPGTKEDFNFPYILENHLNFAISSVKWEELLEASQYSTFQGYINFLHAVREYKLGESLRRVAKNVNSSLIEEFLGKTSGDLKDLISSINNVKFLTNIVEQEFNKNLKLFLAGVYYLKEMDIPITTILWSMIQTS